MKRILYIGVYLIASESLFAQDPQFSQYYQAPLYLNPGFTGITPQQRVVLNNRIQWPNLPKAFTTYAASYDIFVEELRSGFGMLLTADKMGSAGWQTTSASLLYSYKIKFADNFVFSPGLSFGYGTNGIDHSKIRFGDGIQYQRPDGEYNSVDPDQGKIGRQSYFDVGAGALLYTRLWWVGVAFSHMNEPNISVLGDVSKLPMKGTAHVGLRLNLSGGGPKSSAYRMSYLTPSIMYRWQGPNFSQMDMGINYHIDPVSVGLWYRGKPWQKSVINSITQDAVIVTLGLYMKNLTVGYSYDFTVSEMQTSSGGAHEISIVYQFSTKPVQRSVKKKYQLIPCPTFNSKEGFWN